MNKDYINQLVGKKVIFKLTSDEELIGILKDYKENLIIERDGIGLVIELYELFGIEEYKEIKV